MLVMLRTDWPAEAFRRAGLDFPRGTPIDVSEDTLKTLAGDLGKALVLVSAPARKADHVATLEAAEDLDAFLQKTAAPAAVDDAASTAAHASAAPAPTTDAPPRRKR